MSTPHAFQTEVQQLLDLMIHSLYSEREIFLRELISNASDACDRLRFEALTDKDLLKGDGDLKIDVDFDEEHHTLTITDNGIGMTAEEAINQLGTIAKSGTKEFVSTLNEAQSADAASLIGQFGVGFYASFMVAERIVVESRSARVSSDEGVRWVSSGGGAFETETIARPQRGTTVTIELREDAHEFASHWRLHGLIKKYSDYVSYPIFMARYLTDEEKNEGKEAESEQVNEGQALWTRPKDEITDEQYKGFYQSACKQWDEPATRIHFSVEGALSFTALLFVPGSKPMDLFDRNRQGLSLYVRRVFIMDDCDDLLPEYLRFVKGVVDSDDLPLNVSREILQQQATVAKLRKQLVKRILGHLEQLADSEEEAGRATFTAIEEDFGPIMREGIVGDFTHKEQLARIARYQSTWTLAQEQPADGPPVKTGLAAYKERMSEGQEEIYYLTAPSLAAAQASPQVEGYQKRGYEVLYLVHPVDDYMMQYGSLAEFDGTKLVHIGKGDADLGDEEEKQALAEKSEEFKDFLAFCQEHLPDVKEVRLTARLTDSPCCLVTEAGGLSHGLEEVMRNLGQEVPQQQRILELNPDHDLVRLLKTNWASRSKKRKDKVPEQLAVLRDQALLAEGGKIEDNAAFANRIRDILADALGK